MLLDKTTVRAGVDGTVVQFALRPGDVINPLLRPAGIIIPADAGSDAMVAGFSQLAGQVLKVGMVGEVSCASKPFTIIPVVITQIQDAIATGQFRPTDQLIDFSQIPAGTITAFIRPLYAGQLTDSPPGSSVNIEQRMSSIACDLPSQSTHRDAALCRHTSPQCGWHLRT